MLKEFFISFALAIVIFSFVLLMGNIFKITDLIINKHVGLGLILRFLANTFSHLLSYIIPMSMLTASLMCFSRLSSDHEVVAMKASGLSLGNIIKPFILMGCLVSFILLLLNHTIIPQANYRNLLFLKEMASKKPQALLEERVFNENFDNFVVYVDKIKKSKLEGVHIWELREQGTPRVITAREGEFITSGDKNTLILKLGKGTIEEVYEKDSVKYHKLDFINHFIQLSCGHLEDGFSEKRAKDMTFIELKKKIDELKRKGVGIGPLLTEYYQRQALSFSTLPFILVGMSLVIKTKRGTRSFGFGISLVVFIVYYLLLMLGETLSRKGINPGLSMWAPNIIWGVVGIFFMAREARR
jgi:lipopolysaccharide export system permease protein